ncbi:virulence factor, partial [Burkholderia sp. 22313]
LIATVLMATLMAHVEQPDPAHLEIGDWMKRFFVVPGLAALMAFLFTTAMVRSPQAAPVKDPAAKVAPAAEDQAKPFVAQVVGLIWLNPLQRMDYPTEWQLLWTQGLVAPNQNDDMVRTKPEKYSSLRSIGALVYGNEGEETFKGFHHKYARKFLVLMRSRYFSNDKYFYTVKSESSKDWRELAGMRIEFALPPRLDPIEAKTYLTNEFVECFEIGPPSPKTLWSRDVPPDVQITQGAANAGFTSLNKALDYLQANPD